MDEGPSVSSLVQTRARYHRASWLAFGLAFLSAAGATAQERVATPAPQPLATLPAPALAADSDKAAHADSEVPGADLFRQAKARYAAKDVTGALTLMEEAYAASGRPELLFNLGQLHRELGHCREARESYEHYLSLAPADARRDEAEENRHELERQCPAPAPPPAPATGARPLAATTEPVTKQPYWTPLRIAGWATIGGAAIFAGTAGYFALHSHHLKNELESDIHSDKTTDTPYDSEDVEARGQHAAVVAKGLGVTSIGLAAIGVSLLVFNPGGRRPEMNTVSVSCNGGGATAIYRGSF